MLSAQQVQHIAQLARLALSEQEAQKFSGQLNNIFAYIQKLDEVDIKKVQPTSQVTGLKNVMRPDEVKSFSDRDQLLACSELPVEADQIKVQAAITSH